MLFLNVYATIINIDVNNLHIKVKEYEANNETKNTIRTQQEKKGGILF